MLAGCHVMVSGYQVMVDGCQVMVAGYSKQNFCSILLNIELLLPTDTSLIYTFALAVSPMKLMLGDYPMSHVHTCKNTTEHL